MSEDVTQEDLLKALVEALARPEGAGLSFSEIQEQTGWHTVKIRNSLKRLHKQGRLIVGRAPRQNITGAWSPVPVYSTKQEDVPIEEAAETTIVETALVSPPLLPASP